MRNRTYCLLILLALLLPAKRTMAQTVEVHFTYDACGNRISRSIEAKKIEENGKNVEAENDFLTELQERLDSASISLYPNPTDGKVSIEMAKVVADGITATLTTATGNIMESCKIKGIRHDFDLSGQPSGVYFLRLVAGSETRTWKIVKH